MTSLLILSCSVEAHQAILLVLIVQRTPYLNGCTNQKNYYLGHECFREEPPEPPPTGQDVLSSVGNLNVIFGLNYKNPIDTRGGKKVSFLNYHIGKII